MFGRRSTPEPRGAGGQAYEAKHRKDNEAGRVSGWHVGTRGDGTLIEELSADEQEAWDPHR